MRDTKMPSHSAPVIRTHRTMSRHATLSAVVFGILTTAIGISPAAPRTAARLTTSPDIAKLASPLVDLEATIRVTKFDSAELEKIGADFKTTYSLRNLTLQYKQPDKIRLEGRSQTRGGALLIMNGSMRYYEVPKLRLRKSENLEAHPGRRQSLLEYAGLLSPGTLQFMDGKLLREEKLDDHKFVVYEMRFLGDEKNSFYRIWIDRQTLVTIKREWFDSTGKLRATFLYTDVQEIAPGIWLPTRVEVRNADGLAAAVLSVSGIKPNQGLSDEPFAMTP